MLRYVGIRFCPPLPYMGSETGRTHCLRGISALDGVPSVSVLGGAHLHEHAAGTGDGHDRRQRGDCGGVRSGGGQTIVRHTCSLLLGLFGLLLLGFGILLGLVGLLLGFLLLPGFLLGLLPGFGFGLLRIGELLVGRLLVGELGIIVGLGVGVCLVGLILGLVRRVELRLGVGQLRVRLLEVLLGRPSPSRMRPWRRRWPRRRP